MDLERNATIHRARLEQFAKYFQTSDWPSARVALTRAADRAEKIAERQDCATDLCTGLQVNSEAEALALLDGLDTAQLIARSDSMRLELDALRESQDAAHATYREAVSALERIGGDDTVARLDARRRTLLLEIEDGARLHLDRRLGILAVEVALRSYRDSHRSGMLTRASAAFATMTGGRYSELATSPDDGRDILIAMKADGASRQVGQMSDGTRAQLYLALRIAGFHEFVSGNGAVPFVADDIMESFDDTRAAATLALLADMARSGQVIYLTHHAHLVDLARDACPGAQIHHLPD